MNRERLQKANKILAALRDTYVERIIDFVIDNDAELMDHAEGNVPYYNGEEFANLGEMLRQITVVIGNMPTDQPQQPQQVPERDDVTYVRVEAISFALWAEQVRAGNFRGAVMSLSYLFQIDLQLAAHCTQQFVYKLHRNPHAFAKINQLRVELGRSPSNALMLLSEYFGLEGGAAGRMS